MGWGPWCLVGQGENVQDQLGDYWVVHEITRLEHGSNIVVYLGFLSRDGVFCWWQRTWALIRES